MIQEWRELEKVWDTIDEAEKQFQSWEQHRSPFLDKKAFKQVCSSGFLELEAVISCSAGDLL